ncbi:unnamed protein product [Ambrosiozyma monospora]|uniref:Unnamed protein product n=1 Tax=Ambrosiozyma monospora TaxID=43982 RepID=A0ACB5TS52_AMBMO|nr:unnamed protein product [Ambrosiozyma monospora]
MTNDPTIKLESPTSFSKLDYLNNVPHASQTNTAIESSESSLIDPEYVPRAKELTKPLLTLEDEQIVAFNTIMQHVENFNTTGTGSQIIFLNGVSGSGETLLLNHIIDRFQKGK